MNESLTPAVESQYNATRVLTTDDYLHAADVIAKCSANRLPFVLEALRRGGMDFSDTLNQLRNEDVIDNGFTVAHEDDVQRIIEFVESPVPKNWLKMSKADHLAYRNSKDSNTAIPVEPRDRVCALEIWQELYGYDCAMTHQFSKLVKAVMAKMPEWERPKNFIWCGQAYGLQRISWKKTNVYHNPNSKK